MRTIKFRAWDKKLKRMWSFEELLKVVNYDDSSTLDYLLYGDMWGKFNYVNPLMPGRKWVNEFFNRGVSIEYTPDDFVLMQYTGLKDKNGVEIYGGDIVEHNNIYFGIQNVEVEWFPRTASFFPFSRGDYWAGNDLRLAETQHACRKIGNIYENPELLDNK